MTPDISPLRADATLTFDRPRTSFWAWCLQHDQLRDRLARRFAVPMLAAGITPPEREQAGEPRVLCLTRQHFIKDLAEMRARTRLNYWTLRSRHLGLVFSNFGPRKNLIQTFFRTDPSPAAQAAREAIDTASLRLLEIAVRKHNIRAVVTAQADYWQEEGIKNACSRLGIPFLVQSKEHYVSGWLQENRMKDLRGANYRFTGTAVALFGPMTVRTYVETNAFGPEHIHITGAPRLDVWREATPPAQRDCVTLLSFSKGYLVQGCYVDTLRAFARASASYASTRDERALPPVGFIVKCKNQEDKDAALAVLQDFPGHKLQVVTNVHMVDLLNRSRLVAGFNSLSVLESLLSGATICVPNWGDAVRDPFDLMLQPQDALTRQVVAFPESEHEMERQFLEAALAEPPAPDRGARMQLFRHYFHYPEAGSSSEEAEKFIRSYLK